MTCAEARERAAAYALGALEPDERREMDAHLASPGGHDGCAAEVRRGVATAAELSRTLPPARPDPAVWRAIEARAGGAPARSRLRVGPLGWVAAGAAAIALLWLQAERRDASHLREEAMRADTLAQETNLELARAREELRALEGAVDVQREALALLLRPGTRAVALAPQPGQSGRAVAVVNVDAGRAFVASSSLPPQPGKIYQLWILRGTAPPQPAGFLRTARGAATGEVDSAALVGPPPGALAVSLEPAGGSPSPTQVLLVGKVAG